MDIQQLQCLMAVLYCNSFTYAGETLHLSQSAVSKKIHALENELGIRLIERDGKHIVLSPAGRKLMSNFIGIVENYDHLMLIADEIKREQRGSAYDIRIAAVPTISRYNVILMIEDFKKSHPDINITIEEMETDRVMLMLKYDDFNFAFLGDCAINPDEWCTRVITQEKFMAAMSPHHPFAKRASLKLKDLENQPLILNKPESQLYYPCVDACKAAGFFPKIAHTTARPTIAFEFLHSNNKYVYMGLRQTLLQEKSPLHTAIPIEDSPTFNFVFAWRRNTGLSENASCLIEHISALIEKSTCRQAIIPKQNVPAI